LSIKRTEKLGDFAFRASVGADFVHLGDRESLNCLGVERQFSSIPLPGMVIGAKRK